MGILTESSDEQLEQTRERLLQNNPQSWDIQEALMMELERLKKRIKILEDICVS